MINHHKWISSLPKVNKEISETIEGVGGVLNASTDRELTTYWCKVPSKDFGIALDVLSSFIKEPILDSNELEKERQVILEELAMTKDVPSYSADLLIDEIMWPGNPVGRDVGGSKESVSDISREMLLFNPGINTSSITGSFGRMYIDLA